MADFLPERDSTLVQWLTHFSQTVAADPGAVGLTARWSDEVSEKTVAFVEAYRRANDGNTATRPARAAKNAARAEAKTLARQLAKIIHGTPGVTDAQKLFLGLRVGRTSRRFESGEQGSTGERALASPWLSMLGTASHSIEISATGRRPHNASGMMVFTFVGDQPPASVRQWAWHVNTSKQRQRVTFDALPIGAVVWACAMYFGDAGRVSEVSNVVGCRLAGGSVAV